MFEALLKLKLNTHFLLIFVLPVLTEPSYCMGCFCDEKPCCKAVKLSLEVYFLAQLSGLSMFCYNFMHFKNCFLLWQESEAVLHTSKKNLTKWLIHRKLFSVQHIC